MELVGRESHRVQANMSTKFFINKRYCLVENYSGKEMKAKRRRGGRNSYSITECTSCPIVVCSIGVEDWNYGRPATWKLPHMPVTHIRGCGIAVG